MGRSFTGWRAATALLVLALVGNLYADLREQLVQHISKASSSIDVVVYDIRSNEIAEALVTAKHHGVRIRVIVDAVHSISATPQEKMLEDEGIPVKRITGSSRELLHEKFILFDGSVASTPSYNRSAKSIRGEKTGEGAFITDKASIEVFKTQFDDVWKSAGQTEETE